MSKRLFGPCYFAEGFEGSEGGNVEGITAMATGSGMGGGSVMGDAGSSSGDNTFNFDEFKATYGKDYADKGFMQELVTPEKMFEKIDSLESLVGKKAFIPGENATKEEWDGYRDKIGLKDPSVYEFDDSKLPDNLKNVHPQDFEDKIRNIFYEAGLSKEQARIISSKYDDLMLEANKAALEQIQAKQKELQISDEEFETLATETWGKDREAIQNVAKTLIGKYTPENLKSHVQNMSNKDLIIMASVLKGVSDDYISQDDLAQLRNNTIDSNDGSTVREQAQQELAKLANMSPFDPQYNVQKEKVNSLYNQLNKVK